MAKRNSNFKIGSGEFIGPENFDFFGDFDMQLNEILMTIRLSREEVCDLNILFDDIKHVLSYRWPGCTVLPFGSIITGLGIKNSDADCYVDVPEQLQKHDAYVRIAERLIRQHPQRFCQVMSIPRAKVPIVKFFHRPTQRECDISFTSINGVLNSQFIGLLFNLDNRILPVAILIKYWSKVHNLAGCNLFPNYGLIMMIIFYFQQIKMLPSVEYLQSFCDPYFVKGWDTSFPRDITQYPHIHNQSPPYELLGGFFEYYHNFDFEHNIICPYLGYSIPKSAFTSFNSVPNNFKIYKTICFNNGLPELNIKSYFCVQDVFDHSRNCAGVVPFSTIKTFLEQIRLASEIYINGNPHTFLRELLTLKAQIILPHTTNNKRKAAGGNKGIHKPKKHLQGMKKFHNTIKAMKNNIIVRMQGNKHK